MIWARSLASPRAGRGYKRRISSSRPHATNMPQRTSLFLSATALAAFLHGVCNAQSAAAPSTETVVITGSVSERRMADAPYAISVIDADQLRAAGPQINLSEAVARVPGLVVANRNNYAQDLQISSRGFGARAGFGVRGMRLYADGIPASGPDGQGQVSHFDLAGAQRIEVLRGPFSVLYGNSSGGVIATVSGPVREGRAEVGLDAGSFGLRQIRLGAAAPISNELDIRASASAMEWDGFRPQSEAKKKTGNVRLGWQSANDRVVVLANVLSQPADDPLGLTRAQLDADPRQTTSQAISFDTRKELEQWQLGASWRHRFTDLGTLAEAGFTAYTGKRAVTQWLAIAAATQANARHGGGVIDFDRDFEGVDARFTWRFTGTELVAGVAVERQRDDRRGYLNYTGPDTAPVYGQIGTLRRQENNKASTEDAYVQGEFTLSSDTAVIAGLRAGRVRLAADDAYPSNGDDSGSRHFTYANPVVGLRWKAAPGLNVHASIARGFESPTLGELAYRPDGSGGFNADVEPQKSKQLEIGAKWRSADGAFGVDAAIFRAEVDDEIGVATNAGGRQSFRNVGRTTRQGLEVAAGARFSPQWRASAALTYLDAKYKDDFLACAGIPCNAPSVPVAAGNRIAGTQKGVGFAELVWLPIARTEVGVEARVASGISANDTNTEASGRTTLVALRARHVVPLGEGYDLDLLARLDNATDKAYVGSVIVNDANGRFYEPGAPRSWLLSARVVKKF
jgi:iron complex outermembrane receptor protein